MSTAFSTQQNRSVAVRVALGAILDAQQTAEALRLWQDKYASQPTFSVQYFARECCALFGIEAKRSQLVKSLVSELYIQKLNPAAEKNVAMNVSVNFETHTATPVFQLLFKAMVESTDAQGARDIIRFVETGLIKMELDRDVLRSLQRWLNQNRGDTDILLPLQAMTMLINRAYIGLCEYYGPVKADQILHDAVSLVAKTREGQLFNPEKLL